MHTFYTDGVSPDLNVVPTDGCRRTISGHRLLFAPDATGFTIQIPDGPQEGPLVKLEGAINFRFALQLNNSNFPNFTVLPPKSSGSIFYFSNSQLQPGLEVSEVTLTRGALPALKITKRVAWIDVMLSNAVGTEIGRETVAVENGFAQPSLSLRGFSDGLYQISAEGENPRRIFVRDAIGTDWFGIVDLQFAADQIPHPDQPPRFELNFTARSAQWIYRVFVSKPVDGVEYRIIQYGQALSSAGQSDSEEYDANSSDNNNPPKGSKAKSGSAKGKSNKANPNGQVELVFSYPVTEELENGQRLLEFVTVKNPDQAEPPSLITYRQEPRRHLTFVSVTDPSNGQSEGKAVRSTPILEDLPNPSLDHYDPIVTVYT